jgi:subtilisin family serine protease
MIRTASRRVCLAWAIALLLGGAASAQLASPPPGPNYAPDRVIVKLTPSAAVAAMGRGGALPTGLATALSRAQVREARPLFKDLWPNGLRGPVRAADRATAVRARFPARAARASKDVPQPDLENLLILTLAPGADVPTAVVELLRDSSVVYAEPDYRRSVWLVPNDPYYSSSGAWGQNFPDLWGLKAIKAAAAWDVTTGSNAVVMAVVDTGLDPSHTDIQGRVWSNTDEIAGNGVDDDANGYVDDTRGWNFTSDTNDPRDGHGHGTHVSGTIAAATNNGAGVAGINWAGKILPVKGLDDGGGGWDSWLTNAMRYAAENGADVMNNSWGGYGSSQAFQDVINHCYGLGCIVVAAAGNSGLDVRFFEPANARNIVSVAATQYGDLKPGFSNYGTFIDVAAPGVDILSLRATGTDMYGDGSHTVGANYLYANGTSMACPHVVGCLGLLVAAHPTWTTAQIVGQLAGTADSIDSLNPSFMDQLGTGRVNLQQAVSGSVTRKRMALMSFTVDDLAGDGDGQPDPGERINLVVFAKHLAGSSTGATATISSTDPYVTIVTPSASLGEVTGWKMLHNAASPLVFDVSASWPGRRPVVLKLALTTSDYRREEDLRLFSYAGLAESYPSLPSALTWGASRAGSVEVMNWDYVPWYASAGYQLRSYDGINRWGVTSLPMTTDTDIFSSCYFDFTVVAPPVSTLSYLAPVDPNLPGTLGVLPSAWEFCRGLLPLEMGLASQNVVISRFLDIQPGTAGAWARFYIEECAGRLPLIAGGYEDGTYRPTVVVDRASMAVFMARALKLTLAPYQGLYRDISSTHWAAQYIEAVSTAGIVGGYGDGTYRPNIAVTRDSMAVFVARGLAGGDAGVPPGPPTATFTDVPTSYWAFRYVEYSVSRGVVGGFGDGTYRPANPVTRDAMAVFMYRGFVQPAAAAVVLAGPAVTAVNPAAGGSCGWFSRTSGPAADPGYAYVGFDGVRLGTALAYGGSWAVKFELRQASAPQTPATGPYTTTVSISSTAITTARNLALASGNPYYVVSWDLPAGLTAGNYVLVLSAEDETGAMREVARRPGFVISP